MDKTCVICSKIAKYKCPKCFFHYCSVPCCKEHKKGKCEDKNVSSEISQNEKCERKREVSDLENDSYVPPEKLQLLEGDEEVKNLLTNKHLRDLLMAIDKADDAEKMMHMAMQEPIFVEFANACLKVVDPKSDDED